MAWYAVTATSKAELEQFLQMAVDRRGILHYQEPEKDNCCRLYRFQPGWDRYSGESLRVKEVAAELWEKLGANQPAGGGVTVAMFTPYGKPLPKDEIQLVCRVHAGPPTEEELARVDEQLSPVPTRLENVVEPKEVK